MPDGKPKIEDLYELVEDTVSEHGARDAMFTDLEQYYFLDAQKKDRAADEEGVEVVRLPYGTSAIDLITDLVGDAELGLMVPAASEGKRAKQLADTAEKYLLAVIQQSERAQKQQLLSRAAWIVGMRGCIAGRVMCVEKWLDKQEDGSWQAGQRVPILLQLRDPMYVFPSFGLDGLAYVVEKRKRTVKDLRRSLGDEVLPDKKLKDEVEWAEYWDDTWFCYWADGNPVELGQGKGPWPHRYGGIPYAWDFARQTAKTEPAKRVRPFLKSVGPVIDRMGLLDSAEATFIMQYNGDALMVYSEADTTLDTRSGAINYLEPQDRVEWLRAGRQPLETERAESKYSAQFQKATFPDAMYGMDPGRIMAGYALNLLNQSGQVRIKPIIACLERFLGDLLENVLMVTEYYLTDLTGGPVPFHLVADKEDEMGESFRSREDLTLDAKQLGGWYQVEASLGELMPADEQANLMLSLKSREPGPDGRPMLSWETAVDKWALVDSPADERERIDREAAWNDPRVSALRQALYAAQILQELEEELLKLDIDPAQILGQLMPQPQPEAPPTAMPPGAMPPGAMPPGAEMGMPGVLPQFPPEAMGGQLMPQPMGEFEEGGPPPPPIKSRRFF